MICMSVKHGHTNSNTRANCSILLSDKRIRDAAPELLAALERINNLIFTAPSGSRTVQEHEAESAIVARLVKAAIAKARGDA